MGLVGLLAAWPPASARAQDCDGGDPDGGCIADGGAPNGGDGGDGGQIDGGADGGDGGDAGQDAAVPNLAANTQLEGNGLACAAASPAGSRHSPATAATALCLLFPLLLLALRRRRAMATGLAGGGAALCVMLLGVAAQAQTPFAIDANHFHPTLIPGGILNVDGSATQPGLTVGAGVVTTYASQPLVLVSSISGVQGATGRAGVQSQVLSTFGFSLGVFDFLTLGIDMPMLLYQDLGDTAVQQALHGQSPGPTNAAPGDLRISIKLRVLDNQDSGFGLAFLPMLSVPSGDANSYMGWGTVSFEGRIILDYRLQNGLLLAANVSYFTHSQTVAASLTLGDEIRYGGGVLAPLLPKLLAFLEVYGSVGLQAALGQMVVTKENSPAEGLVGVRYRHDVGFTLQGGAGVGLGQGYGTPTSRVFAGIGYEPAFGINRNRTKPAPVAEVAPVVAQQPVAQALAVAQAPAAAQQPVAQGDDADQDGDGVPDRYDQCPTVAGPREQQGCPPSMVVLAQPAPDTAQGTSDQGAAAPSRLVTLHGWRFETAEPITFVPLRATMLSRSEEIVRALAQLLAERTDIHHVLIEGHADQPGQSAANDEALSLQRAQAVQHILVEQGISRERIRVRGFGKTRRLDESNTPAAQERNNRIEILVVD